MQEWLGLVVAGATFDRQKWDKHRNAAFSRLGSSDPLSNGHFRAFTAGASLTTAALLGLLLWNANEALSRLDYLGKAVARQGETHARIEEHNRSQDGRLDSFESAADSIKRDILESLQRIARIEGRQSLSSPDGARNP